MSDLTRFLELNELVKQWRGSMWETRSIISNSFLDSGLCFHNLNLIKYVISYSYFGVACQSKNRLRLFQFRLYFAAPGETQRGLYLKEAPIFYILGIYLICDGPCLLWQYAILPKSCRARNNLVRLAKIRSLPWLYPTIPVQSADILALTGTTLYLSWVFLVRILEMVILQSRFPV